MANLQNIYCDVSVLVKQKKKKKLDNDDKLMRIPNWIQRWDRTLLVLKLFFIFKDNSSQQHIEKIKKRTLNSFIFGTMNFVQNSEWWTTNCTGSSFKCCELNSLLINVDFVSWTCELVYVESNFPTNAVQGVTPPSRQQSWDGKLQHDTRENGWMKLYCLSFNFFKMRSWSINASSLRRWC